MKKIALAYLRGLATGAGIGVVMLLAHYLFR